MCNCRIENRSTNRVCILSFPDSFASSELYSSRQVDSTEGKQLALDNKAAFVETSAKANQHVGQWSLSGLSQCRQRFDSLSLAAEVFERCLEEIQKRAPNNQADPQTSRCIVM